MKKVWVVICLRETDSTDYRTDSWWLRTPKYLSEEEATLKAHDFARNEPGVRFGVFELCGAAVRETTNWEEAR